MKKYLALIIVSLSATLGLNAHCGTCGTGEAHSHEACPADCKKACCTGEAKEACPADCKKACCTGEKKDCATACASEKKSACPADCQKACCTDKAACSTKKESCSTDKADCKKSSCDGDKKKDCDKKECSSEKKACGPDCQKECCKGVAATGCTDTQVAAYLEIQNALASDDLAAAKAAAAPLAKCDKEGCAPAATAAAAIVSADDIAAARVAFKRFSDSLISEVAMHGSATPLVQMTCPMAFNNTGATWLQTSNAVRNPYFGSSMLACGMKVASHGAN